MCRSCWEEYGSHAIVDAETIAAAKLVDEVYEFSCVGGNGHVAFDDWNLDDGSIRWCIDVALVSNIHGACADQRAAERAALDALLALPLDRRVSAMAIFGGYVQPEPTDGR